MKSQFMIAAPMSGSGKTTLARGLMALFREKGYQVQPFKCGPDYIDTKFHSAVCHRPSINLDTFLATPEHVRKLFGHYGADADICVVEGMMGLFDGYDREYGSSYEIARVLDLPVVLVVDARSAAYSMAALLSGFLTFRKDIRFVGIIFNKVGSKRHETMLREVCDELDIKCLGCLPKESSLEQSSRYLGLDFSQQTETIHLLELLEEYVDWKGLMESGETKVQNREWRDINSESRKATGSRVFREWRAERREPRVLIARNSESFSFLYQETLDGFSETRFFDPEYEVPSFEGIDLLYLPGGYPEKHLETLKQNEGCRKAIKEFAEQGGRIVAECGGMMYLCKEIVNDEGAFPMCDVLPYSITARKADRKLSLGYRQFTLDGKEYRGHEFHYTNFLGEKPQSVVQVYNAKEQPVDTPVFRYKNVLASYTHLYLSVE